MDRFDPIAETPEFPDHLRSTALGTVFGDGRSAFLIRDLVVQDLPHQAAEPVGDRPDRLGVSESDDQAPIHELEDTAFGLDRGIGRLIE